ncbi:hypothetical protein Avbf_08087 [Armadillidium vulgare]|nr:hypothetical protein Avbf_08087 [Armadillidium vulgare]
MLLENFNSIDALEGQNDDYKLIAFTDSSKMIYDFLTNSGFNIDQMEVIVPNPVIISTKPLKEEILCNTATTTDPSIPIPITNFGKFSFSSFEVLDYLNSKNKLHKDMPNIVSQLNLFKDEKGLLRVKSKFNRYKDKYKNYFPILLHKNSPITEMIILDMHKKTSHASFYTLLSEIRKEWWIPNFFSTVKKIVNKCVNCKRFTNRTISLNASPYREHRLNPPNIPYRNFEFIVAQTVHLVNRRPVAFKEALRDSGQDIPAAITPEILLKGHELISLNIIPNLQPDPETEDDIDISWTTDDTINHIKDSYEKLKKLAQQATDKKSRFMPKTHSKLEIGDIVLIKEPFLKPTNYPMGKVEQVQININNEVTGTTLLKGNKEELKDFDTPIKE